MILVDSNILIDVLGEGQAWRDWSVAKIAELTGTNRIIANQIVFAEVAPRLGSLEVFRHWLDSFEIEYIALDEESAFVAGSAFQTYRARRRQEEIGSGTVLPDFLIGGHAQVLGASILTRDPRFYRTYFPTVSLITPDKAE
jgi:predicted nucleic acid-binding protein